MDSYIYLSYSMRDKEFVDRLAFDLRRQGYEVWRDVDDVLPGDSWRLANAKALENAAVIIAVMSAAALNSSSVRFEFSRIEKYQTQSEKLVIPVLIDDLVMVSDLRDLQVADFRKSYESGFAALLTSLPTPTKSPKPKSATPQKPKSRGYVFVSYVEEDAKFADELRLFFKNLGYAYWDYRDTERNYQVPLGWEIEEALREASAVVAVLSPDWKVSIWARDEYDYAREIDKPLFALMCRRMEATLGVTNRPYIDFTLDSDQAQAKLKEQLKREGL